MKELVKWFTICKINGFYPHEMNILVATGKDLVPRKGYKGEWIIDLPYWPQSEEIINWCYETLGDQGHDRKYKWRLQNIDQNRIFLRNECDVTLFTLRWLGDGNNIKWYK